VVTTRNEAAVLRGIAPEAQISVVENGVDATYFDGLSRPLPGRRPGRFVTFVGTMDYPPNIDAAVRFTNEIFPQLRRRIPDLQFVVVGRNPARAVRELQRREGVQVTGAVPDVRPYLARACAVVAPLALARGIQNKVLEALAMGRRVFASAAVCRTFGRDLPAGVIGCSSNQDFLEAIEGAAAEMPACDTAIRRAAIDRFCWTRNASRIGNEMERICTRNERCASIVLAR
jgi:glycosyltransferase involved in cell wall biosynthesis